MKKFLLLIVVLIFIFLGAYLWVEPAEMPIVEESIPAAPIISEPEKIIEPGLTISPTKILQGDPALITVTDLPNNVKAKSLTFDGKSIALFEHDGKTSALVGIDLRGRVGAYPTVLTLSDGKIIKKDLIVGERTIAKAPLGIPEELGGDTPEAEKELINTLVQEGALISAIPVSSAKLWSGEFRLPLNGPIVITDTYGYSRLTGASTISHKGTDFRAAVGTPVYAMNSGVVRFVRFLRNYGHTVAIDHGTGILSIYMHLSEPMVKEGDSVSKGELIAKSGNTGYVLGPHLHLTVRINQISIDPQKFMALPF